MNNVKIIRQVLLTSAALLMVASSGMGTDKKPERESLAVVKQQISIMNQEVMITWHAKVEDDLKFYLIERKEGENFEVFGLSMRNRNHDQFAIKEYQFFDEEPQTGINIYRLVEVDFQDNKRYHEELKIDYSSSFESAATVSSTSDQN